MPFRAYTLHERKDKMKAFKRIGAIVLTGAMVFGMSMTAFAEEYTITINKPTSSSITLANHTYEAYQIFSAVLDSAHTDSQEGTLSQIRWGTNANGAAIIDALTGTNAPAELKTAFASCAAKRSRWSMGSLSSEYALHISHPFMKSSNLSTLPGSSGFFLVNGDISIG